MLKQPGSNEHPRQTDGHAPSDVHAELEALRREVRTLTTRVDSLERGPARRSLDPLDNLIGDEGDEAGPVGPTTGSTKPPT